HSQAVSCLSFADDGNKLASGGADNLAVVWDVKTGTGKELKQPAAVTAVKMITTGGLLTGDAGGTLRVWDVASGLLIANIRAHGDAVTKVEVLDQKIVSGGYLSSSRDGTVRHWVRSKADRPFEAVKSYRGLGQPVTGFVQGNNFFAYGGEGGTVAFG